MCACRSGAPGRRRWSVGFAGTEGLRDRTALASSAWRSGDSSGLSKLFVQEMKTEAPELYDSLLYQRNLRWVPQIDQMLQDSNTEFVLVGAAHLVGEGGLLDLLAQKGYEIEQL
ncbi:MAG: TraB/GumN family protein [Pseudohongiellaceae bacterium]